MKTIQRALIIGHNQAMIDELKQTLGKEGVSVVHFHETPIYTNPEITQEWTASEIDVVISCLDCTEAEWTIIKNLSEDHPLVFLSSAQGDVTPIGSDFADAWISLEDAKDLLYKAALRAVQRRQIKAA